MPDKLKVLDLFSGIGGFSLGLERTGGFSTVAFCEIEEFPRRVLAKHWPNVPCYRDVRELTAERLAADGIAVDVICGGFPCQDISTAGKGAGLAGERSGLFYEIARLVGELEPRYVILENVAALLSRGLADVLGTLASLGYDAEWHCIPASALGAPHHRDRMWIIGWPAIGWDLADSQRTGAGRPAKVRIAFDADKGCQGLAQGWIASLADPLRNNEQGQQSGSVDAQEWSGPLIGSLGSRCDGPGWWRAEPNVGRVANGVPDRAHRLKGLGNAVVPQIPELIGNAILDAINWRKEAA
jgi:DNA (cytosine-5)-methyltransferase 1